MPSTLLIGYGNTLRGDDALGPMAIERLRTLLAEAEFVSCHQLTPELAEGIAACDLVVFIDAACDGEPGAVRVHHLSSAPEISASLTHHADPASLLQLTRTLYGRAPQAMLVTGTGATFDNCEGLSEKGREALDELCRVVPALVREISSTS